MTAKELRAKVLGILRSRYPDYGSKPAGERILLAMSVLANDLRIRETGGANRGLYVEPIIAATGLNPQGGYSWCAATVEFCCEVANVPHGPTDPTSARVAAWINYGSQNGRLRQIPGRGMLCCRLNPDGVTGHMGIVAQVYPDGRLRTYEGNTSGGNLGSQDNGDGMYERIRPRGFFTRFIYMNT